MSVSEKVGLVGVVAIVFILNVIAWDIYATMRRHREIAALADAALHVKPCVENRAPPCVNDNGAPIDFKHYFAARNEIHLDWRGCQITMADFEDCIHHSKRWKP